MELEGFHVQDEYKSLKKSNSNSAEASPFHQVVSNMQEAAMSIYEQYLSEKVLDTFLILLSRVLSVHSLLIENRLLLVSGLTK